MGSPAGNGSLPGSAGETLTGRPAEPWQPFDNIRLPIVLLDTDGRFRQANSAAEQLLGLSRQQLVGTHLIESLLSAGELVPAVHRFDTSQESVLVKNTLVITRDNCEHRMDCWISNAAGDSGCVQLEWHPAYEEPLTEASIEQRQILTLVRQVLAHEIRNPLGGMRGAAQLLEKALDDPALIAYAKVIMREADRLDALVERFSAASGNGQTAAANLHRVLDQAAEIVVLEAPGLQVTRDYDPSIPEIQADSAALKQLFLNLIKNAAQANAGAITLSSRVIHDQILQRRRHRLAVSVKVRDDGDGVPEDIADNLFLPLVTGRRGSGLGLPIALDIARRHGGELSYHRQKTGSCFKLVLPPGPGHDR